MALWEFSHKVKIPYIGQRISNRCPKNVHIRDIDGKELEERKTNAISEFISSMKMILVLGFATNVKGRPENQIILWRRKSRFCALRRCLIVFTLVS